MLVRVKRIYHKALAGIALFTVETILTVLLFFGCLMVFLAVAKYVFLDRKEHFDQRAFNFLESFIKDGVTDLMLFLGVVGNYQVMIAANLLLICYFLFVKKHKWYSIKIPAISLSSVLLMSILKLIFNRPRPLIPLMEPARGLSFPSGHAMMSVTFFGLLIYFLFRKNMRPVVKVLSITFLVLVIISIGVSRIYLRVHYASDVIAGICLGVIWLTIAVKLLNRIELYSKRNLNQAVDPGSGDNKATLSKSEQN